jgi:hypothetical protein
MTLIEQLARYLADEGIGPFEGKESGAIFSGVMPPAPQRAINVRATDLRTPGDTDGARVQIGVRSEGATPWSLEKAIEIVELLADLRDLLFTPDGFYIIGIELMNGPSFGSLEPNVEQLYYSNFRIYYCK